MSTQLSIEKAHETRNVDLGAAGRGVWLVKVPKYLKDKWEKSPGNSEVGKMRITRSKFPGQKPEVRFTLNESLTKAAPGELSCPQDHKMVLTGTANQHLVVFSQTPVMVKTESSTGSSTEVASERLAIEGKVIQRAECRPDASQSYLKLKKLQVETSNKPKREVIQLKNIVLSYKPVKDHVHNTDYKDKQKTEMKRSRDAKEKVMDVLFNAFEKHQYYNVKDLVTLTKQPVTYLKEILKEICTYNMKAPHKNMWELKPEYRHYKDPEQSGS